MEIRACRQVVLCVFPFSPVAGFPPRWLHVVECWVRLCWRVALGEWDVPLGGHHLCSAHIHMTFTLISNSFLSFITLWIHYCHLNFFYFLSTPHVIPWHIHPFWPVMLCFFLSTFLCPSSLTFYHTVSCFLLSHLSHIFSVSTSSLRVLTPSVYPLSLHSQLFSFPYWIRSIRNVRDFRYHKGFCSLANLGALCKYVQIGTPVNTKQYTCHICSDLSLFFNNISHPGCGDEAYSWRARKLICVECRGNLTRCQTEENRDTDMLKQKWDRGKSRWRNWGMRRKEIKT